MKKIFSIILTAVLLCGCRNSQEINFIKQSEISETEKLPEANSEDFEFSETDGGVAVTKYIGSLKEFAVPEKIDGRTVVEIGSKAFCGCEDIQRVEIPDTVTRISKSNALKFCAGYDADTDGKPLGEVIATGADIEEANIYYDEINRNYFICLTFTPSGTEKFAEATKNMVGETLSIWIDDELIISPMVSEPVVDGKTVISGNFSFEEVEEYAAKINGNPFEGCGQIRVIYKGRNYGYEDLDKFYSAVKVSENNLKEIENGTDY